MTSFQILNNIAFLVIIRVLIFAKLMYLHCILLHYAYWCDDYPDRNRDFFKENQMQSISQFFWHSRSPNGFYTPTSLIMPSVEEFISLRIWLRQEQRSLYLQLRILGRKNLNRI